MNAGGTKPTVTFAPDEKNADVILRTILAQAGRSFHESKEEIGVVEAVLPPLILGAIGGFFMFGVYSAAGEIEQGEELEVTGLRRRGLKRLLIFAAQILGTKGSMAAGVVLGVATLGWMIRRIVRRPERAVWVPAEATS